MKLPLPREPARGNNGYYGGVGSKTAPRPWRPAARRDEAADAVTKRRGIPRLQLRRSRRARPEDHEGSVPGAIVFAWIIMGLFLLSLFVGCGSEEAAKEVKAKAGDGFLLKLERGEDRSTWAAGTATIYAETGARNLNVSAAFDATDDAAAILGKARAALAAAGWSVGEADAGTGLPVLSGPGDVRLTAFSVMPRYEGDAKTDDAWNLGPLPRSAAD